MNRSSVRDFCLITDDDLYLFNEGSHFRLYEKMGAHSAAIDGERGVYFAVWAPNAEQVSVVGDFNQWDGARHPLRSRNSSGIWEGCLAGIGKGAQYKFRIRTKHFGYVVDKADPFAFYAQAPPNTASVVWDLDYSWQDQKWMGDRHARNSMHAPISIYEIHLGSWQRVPEDNHRALTYRELAPRLADHVTGKTDYYECEHRARHKNGHWVWVLSRGKIASRTPDGRAEWFAGTLHRLG